MKVRPCLEDHPSGCKYLGSPGFISHEKAIGKGNHPQLGDLLTMVVDHLLAAMIPQVCFGLGPRYI